MREFDAYLFDADGTLVDSRQLIHRSFDAMAEKMGHKHLDHALVEATIGLPMVKQIRILLGQGHPDEYYEQAGRAYGDGIMAGYHEYLSAFPGVSTGLAELKKRGKKIACVTSRRLYSLEAFFGFLDFNRYFDLLVTPESTTGHKPGPEPALFAMEQLGVTPDQSVFIGDAVFDIQCGHSAGISTVLVSWGGMDPKDWEVQPDYVIHSFDELLN